MWEYEHTLNYNSALQSAHKTFHLTVVVSFVDSSIPCTHSAYNRDSSVNRPILNCITIADNRFKNRVQKFTAYAVCS